MSRNGHGVKAVEYTTPTIERKTGWLMKIGYLMPPMMLVGMLALAAGIVGLYANANTPPVAVPEVKSFMATIGEDQLQLFESRIDAKFKEIEKSITKKTPNNVDEGALKSGELQGLRDQLRKIAEQAKGLDEKITKSFMPMEWHKGIEKLPTIVSGIESQLKMINEMKAAQAEIKTVIGQLSVTSSGDAMKQLSKETQTISKRLDVLDQLLQQVLQNRSQKNNTWIIAVNSKGFPTRDFKELFVDLFIDQTFLRYSDNRIGLQLWTGEDNQELLALGGKFDSKSIKDFQVEGSLPIVGKVAERMKLLFQTTDEKTSRRGIVLIAADADNWQADDANWGNIQVDIVLVQRDKEPPQMDEKLAKWARFTALRRGSLTYVIVKPEEKPEEFNQTIKVHLRRLIHPQIVREVQ